MDSTNFKGKLKKFFKERSKPPRESSLPIAKSPSTSLHSSLRPALPHLQQAPPLHVKGSSSSLRADASIQNNTTGQTSERSTDSQSLSPLLTSRLSTSPGAAQLLASTSLLATAISPSVLIAKELPSPPAEETSSTPAPPLNLWKEVFDKVDNDTKKWIQDHGLNSMELSQPEGQINELITLLQSKTLSEEKYMPLKIEIGNQKIVFREYIADVVTFLTMAGDAAITFAPPQASAPWAAAKALLKIPVKRVEQMAALAGTIQWFTRIVRRGQVYELLYNTTTADEEIVSNLHDALRDLYVAAMELLARSDVLFGSGRVKQTLTALLRPEQASGLISDLSKKEQKVLLEVQGCEASRNAKAGMKIDQRISDALKLLDEMSTPLTRIDEGVSKLLEEVDKDRLEKLMDFISSEQFGKGHATIQDARTENTGDWLINHQGFRDWQAIPSSSTVLCLKGTVGTGKTFLTSRVIEHIKRTLETSTHDEGFAFFYCNRSGTSMQDPLIVLRSLVRQLSYRAYDYDHIQKNVIERYQRAKQEGRNLSYKDCVELILESLNLYSRTTIILDALDESDIMSYNLAEILIDLMGKATKPVKIFISSRPGREYLEAFETESTITVDSSSQQGDIEKFLDEKLYSTPFFQRRQKGLQDLIKETFASQNGGMFRWVYLQVHRLKPCTSDDAIRTWAKTIPPDLMGAYEQLWNNINEQHNEDDIALAERAIQWVLCSTVPLKSQMLLEAIRYVLEGDSLIQKEQQSEQQILSLCQDLLTIDTERQVWMLPHASVAEYFESKGLVLGKCDVFAVRICLNFLMRFEWDAYQGEYPYPSTELEKFGQYKDNPYPSTVSENFEVYAVYAWFKHVERYDKSLGPSEGTDADANLVDTLKRFLGLPKESSDCYRKWVERLSPAWSNKEQLTPSDMPLFTICRYGFYYVLRDWWEKDKINEEMALLRAEREDYNALALAAEGGCMPICKFLVSIMDINNPLSRGHCEAMACAIDGSRKDITSLLVVQGRADANFSYDYCSPVQWAAMERPDMLQWLVDQGWVDVNRENDNLWGTALNAAAMRRLQSVEILLKAGANVNALCGRIGSALVAAALNTPAIRTDMPKITQLLIDHGADPNLPLKVGPFGSALELILRGAASFFMLPSPDYRKLLEIMLKAGADPAMLLDMGDHGSALAAAACYGLTDLLAMMIGVTGKDRAIKCLEQSRHPEHIKFPEGDLDIWMKSAEDTIAYLTDQIGVDKDTLYKIGLWQFEPEEVGTVDDGYFIYH